MASIQESFAGIMEWVDARLPVTETYEKHMTKYFAPKNFNFWYLFGVLCGIDNEFDNLPLNTVEG